MNPKKIIPLLLGPLLFFILQSLDTPEGMPDAAYDVLCATLWIAIWWVSEAVPIAVTSLLPIVLFPLTGALDLSATTASYGHKYVFLYLGGFFIAIAIEKWNLHKRIALYIIRGIGTNVSKIILGFMIATAFLSMWISNTATAVMMLPIGMSIVAQLKDNPSTDINENLIFGKALMLGIAYSASIGGIATLIGTPPNLVMAGYVEEVYNIEISFWQWMKFGFPIALLLLIICWPSHAASPEVSKLAASAIPPPKSRIIPQGIFPASSHFMMRSLFLFAGSVKSRIPAAMAITVSSIPGMKGSRKNDLPIQQTAVSVNTVSTVFSSRFIGPNSFVSRKISSFPPGKDFCLKVNAKWVR